MIPQIKSKFVIQNELAKRYNLPIQVISVICNHPFLFANKVMTEMIDRSIYLPYFGKFKLKNRHKDEATKETRSEDAESRD